MREEIIKTCKRLLDECDAVLIGAGAGLTAAAGISYTDKKKFAELFPAWVKKGFSMQYQLMGYTNWSQAEQWGYYTIHLGYVYFEQTTNPLYQKLRKVIGEKDYFVMTSNVDEFFHKNGFDRERIYSPQGSYGKIQCTIPCSDKVWDMKPYFDKMRQALHPTEQYITDEACIPKCPNCGSPMFINARIDHSFIDKPYRIERTRLEAWLNRLRNQKLLLLELGSGYNTPVVIRMPMESIASSFNNSSFIRVNAEHAQVPDSIKHKSISVNGDIANFIEGVLK